MLEFGVQNYTPISVKININNTEYLPLPLKRIIHNQEEFIEKIADNSYILNEDGCFLFDSWLSDREVPANRDNYKKYINNNSNSRKWMLENHSCSYTDCYWTKEESEDITYNDILKYLQKIDVYDRYFNISDENHMYKGQNSTLGGQLEKFWYKSDDILKLCKKVDRYYDILNAREVVASLIYKKQGFNNYCNYDFVYNTKNEVVGCKCTAFTNPSIELITAYDLLEEHNLTQQDCVYELIPFLTEEYGGDLQKTSQQMDMETLVDFICLNRDRHQENIGFLRNNETMQVISMAPIYDSGSCKHLEGEKPEDAGAAKINGLYSTEEELLSHVKDFSVLDLNKLPNIEEIREIYNCCKYISPERKEELLSLYKERINFVREKQKVQKLCESQDKKKKFEIPDNILKLIKNNKLGELSNLLDDGVTNNKTETEDKIPVVVDISKGQNAQDYLINSIRDEDDIML